MSRLLCRIRKSIDCVRQVSVSHYATFTQRDFHYVDHSHSGTLLSRFTREIAMDINRDAKIVRNSIKYSQFYPVQNQEKYQRDIQDVSSDQLARLVMFTANYRGNADISKIYWVINHLDSEATQRIHQMEYRDVQELMFMFLYLLPNKVTELDFLRSGIEKLIAAYTENETKENFLQISFYLGLFKKSQRYSNQLKTFLQSNLSKHLSDLNTLEFAIVANSAFKASVLITDQDFQQRLIQEILSINKDVDIQLLVTFAKSLRHNRVNCTRILDKVQELLERKSIPDIDLRSYVHLLALFVENRQIPQTFGMHIMEKCMNIIKAEHEKSLQLSKNEAYTNPNFRPKDLATFLWCATSLPDKTLTKDDINTVCNAMLWKLRNYEYKYAYDEFVDSLLSLVMLGGRSEALFKAFLTDRNFLIPPRDPNRTKILSRQRLLQTCLEIEVPRLVPKDKATGSRTPVNAPKYLLDNRQHFQSITQSLEELRDEFKITKLELKVPVRDINIPSFLIETQEGTKRSFWIEILDKQTTMADLKSPTPIVRLKLRLLRNLEQDFIVVNTINKEGEELKEILRQAIKEHLDYVDSESDAEIQEVVK
uniref:Uncharacterized protein n=1 Tax=Nyssomyia neivai TaxID=330878 RepID=A0A1L8DD71_9DIPT